MFPLHILAGLSYMTAYTDWSQGAVMSFLISLQSGRNSCKPRDSKLAPATVESLARYLRGLRMVLGSATGASSTANLTRSATARESLVKTIWLETFLVGCESTWPGRTWSPCCVRCTWSSLLQTSGCTPSNPLADHTWRARGSWISTQDYKMWRRPQISPPEVAISVRVERRVFPTIRISTQISQPDVVAGVTENEGEAPLAGGHPAGGGAEEAVLEVDRAASTSPHTGNTVELEDVAVLCHSLVHLHLVIEAGEMRTVRCEAVTE